MKQTLIETSILIKNKQINSNKLVSISNNSLQKLLKLNIFLEIDEEKSLEDYSLNNKNIKKNSLISGTLISIKDNFMVKDTRTSAASRVLDNLISPYDATVVSSLKQNGAVIYGKTNLDEFGMGSSTSNSAFGPTWNPWNYVDNLPKEDILSPGGSSGGSASAVASYLCQGAIGSDTGGSVRQPASFCGIVGFKPTYGSLSRHGLISYASSFDTPGILTRTVLDSAVLFDSMYHGKDINDPTSIDLYSNYIPNSSLFSPNQPLSCLLSSSSSSSSSITTPLSSEDILQSLLLSSQKKLDNSLKGLIIGVPIEFSLFELDSQVKAHWDNTLKMLADAGAIIQTISIPSLRMSLPTYYLLACAEASSNLSRYDGIRFGYRHVKSNQIIQSNNNNSNNENLDNVADELHHEISLTRGESFGPQVLRRILAGTYVLSESAYHSYYTKAVIARQRIASDLNLILNSNYQTNLNTNSNNNNNNKIDCIVGPTSPILPFYMEEQPDFANMLSNDFMTVSANLVGIPAISVPVGTAIKQRRSDSTKQLTVPVGMQIMAGKGREDIIFRTALAIEQRAQFVLHTV